MIDLLKLGQLFLSLVIYIVIYYNVKLIISDALSVHLSSVINILFKI